jgi:hypothetical protein
MPDADLGGCLLTLERAGSHNCELAGGLGEFTHDMEI